METNDKCTDNDVVKNVSKEQSEKSSEVNLESKGDNCAKFKKPQIIIGKQRRKHGQYKCLKTVTETENRSESNELEREERETKNNTTNNVNNKQDSKQPPPLHYNEPDWGGFPAQDYKLEELKSGTIVRTIDLSKKTFVVFGRLETCDISMLHPTVSRYHAILQYRAEGEADNDRGFYIYDLGSSLGTFLNKRRLKPKVYVRVKVGHILKIGCSTRMFILQGPEDDEEPESDLTVTELRQQQRDRLAALEAEKARLEAEEEDRLRREEERGVDWGMGEDADEETDLTENPYASTQNEELYLEDPKKTLRGWFEREGEELVYDVEEKGFGSFVCRIELPVDNGGGGNLVAEASLKGKKKEVVVQAALEACRLLDRQGLLRQANHESKKKAAKDWEAVDFYDSDEDNFLDRTGQVEKKRQQRMAQAGKLEAAVETYDSLMEKYREVVAELERGEQRLEKMLSLATKAASRADTEDDLDAYMSYLQHAPADKVELKKLKDEVARLRSEEGRVRNLVNIARPTELPKLEPTPFKPAKEKKLERPQGMIGKKSVKKRPHQDSSLPLKTTQQQTNDCQEEFDEEEDKPEPADPDDSAVRVEEVKKKKKSRLDTRIRNKKHVPILEVDSDDYSNCTWKPPAGQTGDGRTSLNDKLGY